MCDAAQWTLGGIPINYYYSVDFDALISLVDAIGGVDFDMDMSYQGDYGYYHKGAQHLDGLGVLGIVGNAFDIFPVFASRDTVNI